MLDCFYRLDQNKSYQKLDYLVTAPFSPVTATSVLCEKMLKDFSLLVNFTSVRLVADPGTRGHFFLKNKIRDPCIPNGSTGTIIASQA